MLGRLASFLRSAFGGRRPASGRSVAFERQVRGSYDAAQTNDNNSRHWQWADDLSADAGQTPEVRRELRRRARYEVANNCYAKGITLTLANETIGCGPRLQINAGSRAASSKVEAAFAAWSTAVQLPAKLRLLRAAKAVDGESFALFTTNRSLRTSVKLDLRLIEAEQVSTPGLLPIGESAVDGIVFDADGNPRTYHLLRAHPGGTSFGAWGQADSIDAASMLHLYRCDRPGQHRGVSELTPALPLFAQLRRFTLATLRAAEFAAAPAGVMRTDSPALTSVANADAMDAIPYELGALLTLPQGWSMEQIDPKHPGTTYAMFKAELINEIARCLNMPYNVAACNSASYNYASGRMDHQVFRQSLEVEQDYFETACLDRILAAWLDEAALVPGLLPPGTAPYGDWPHQWFWGGITHVDPTKEASAQQTRLANHTTTLADEYAAQGQDWEQQLRQRARELALMRELQVPLSIGGQPPQPGASANQSATDDAQDEQPTNADA